MVAPACALSVMTIVHSFDRPEPGTVGVNEMSSVSEVPRFPKYSTDRGRVSPEDPTAVSVAGRLTPRLMVVVGSPEVWLKLIRTGSSADGVSRANVGIEPSESAGQPSRTRPASVLRMPVESVRNDPVVVIFIGLVFTSPASSVTSSVTGSMPRPVTAMSSGWLVATSGPCSSMVRVVIACTPPAE